MTGEFKPKLIALDVDGTLYANVPSTGGVEEVISPPVLAAINRAWEEISARRAQEPAPA